MRSMTCETSRDASGAWRSPAGRRSPLPFGRAAGGTGSDRHRHRLEGGVAIDQVDALLDDAEALAVAPQAVVLAARKDALRILARLDHDDGRADEILALALVG